MSRSWITVPKTWCEIGMCAIAVFYCLSFVGLIYLFATSHEFPEIKLEKLYIPALDIKNLNSSSDTSLSFDIIFRNRNANSDVYYDPINITFYDNPNGNDSIANFTIPKFAETLATRYSYADVHKQGTVNTTSLDTKEAIKEILANGFKIFRVDLDVSVRYDYYFFWKTTRYEYNKGFNVKIGDTGDAANIGNFFGAIGVLLVNVIVIVFLH